MRCAWLAAGLAAAMVITGCSTTGSPSSSEASGAASSATGSARVAASPSSAATAAKPGNYVLIMDASGSMRKSDVGAGTRMTAAQDAASRFVSSLPKGSSVGLVSYGDKTLEEAPKESGCGDVSVAVPLGTDTAKVVTAAKALRPVGWTPIAKALSTAAAQAKGRPLNVVLVTDGEDSCAPPDPCQTAASLVSADAGLTISAIGLKTSSDQLSCIASKGKGYFVTAGNSAQLARRLEALRDPAAAARELSPSGVQSIRPGQSAKDIRKAHPDFPAVASGTQVRVIWANCTWTFSAKGVLTSIELAASGGASTIDGLMVGDADSALQVLGTAVSTTASGGVETRIYAADERLGLGWKVQVRNGRIITIVLCTCLTGSCPPSADVVRKAAGEPQDRRVEKINCLSDSSWAIATGIFGPGKNAGWVVLQKKGASWTLASRITSTPGCYGLPADAPLAELRTYMPGMCDWLWGPLMVKQAPITMNGIGDLQLGADGSDLEVGGLAQSTDGQCDANYTTVDKLEDSIDTDFRGSRLTGLWVRDPAMKTNAGAHVGMSVAEVRNLYAGKLALGTHENYIPIKTLVYNAGGKTLEFSYSDPDTGAATSTINGIYVEFSDTPFKHGC